MVVLFRLRTYCEGPPPSYTATSTATRRAFTGMLIGTKPSPAVPPLLDRHPPRLNAVTGVRNCIDAWLYVSVRWPGAAAAASAAAAAAAAFVAATAASTSALV